tara:strand:+ start:19 stop:1158 length:1140 start_codon:yes stop_codon:yes gene_type:complete
MENPAEKKSRPMKADFHPRQAERLATLRQYQILDTPREREFDDIVNLAAQICGAPISVINFIDAERQWFKAEVGLGADETPLDASICAHVILQDELMEIPDTLQDERMADNPLCTGEPNLRFYAGAPLTAPNGLPIGTLCILDHKPRQLTELQRESLRVLSRTIMRDLELRRTLLNQEILRREMDHRVKNSLQTIASFISLFRRTARHSSPEEAFDAIERRVRAISALHEELHQVGFDEEAKLDRFLERVISQLRASSPENVTIRSELSPVVGGSSTATTLGIVVSEFVANSIKHGFSDGRDGEISIRLEADGDMLELECRDNGLGSAVESSETNKIEKLGTRLKEAAVSQVNGELHRESDRNGYVTRLTIPLTVGSAT